MLRSRHDMPAWLAIALPFGSLALCLTIALLDPRMYNQRILAHERGYLELSTVAVLLPSVFMLVWIATRSYLPATWLRVWALVLAAGALYFAGEEASWGQHLFDWETPEAWQGLNDQGETNIHNVHGIFDQMPRNLLTVAAAVGLFVPFMLYWKRRRLWTLRRDWQESFFPTLASAPAGFMALAVGVPQRVYKKIVGSEIGYGEYDPSIHKGIDAMFLRGNHSELKEHFLALFIFVFVLSWTWRVARSSRNETP